VALPRTRRAPLPSGGILVLLLVAFVCPCFVITQQSHAVQGRGWRLCFLGSGVPFVVGVGFDGCGCVGWSGRMGRGGGGGGRGGDGRGGAIAITRDERMILTVCGSGTRMGRCFRMWM